MQTSLEEDLDVVSGRIAELENHIVDMQENITALTMQLKETQHFLIKLAKNQSEITKRVTKWPFIPIDCSSRGDDF